MEVVHYPKVLHGGGYLDALLIPDVHQIGIEVAQEYDGEAWVALSLQF